MIIIENFSQFSKTRYNEHEASSRGIMFVIVSYYFTVSVFFMIIKGVRIGKYGYIPFSFTILITVNNEEIYRDFYHCFSGILQPSYSSYHL